MADESGISGQVDIKVEIKEEAVFVDALSAEDWGHTENPLKEEIKNEEKVNVHLLKDEIIVGGPSCSSEEVSRSRTEVLSGHDGNIYNIASENISSIRQKFGSVGSRYKIVPQGSIEKVNSIRTFGQEEQSETFVSNSMNVNTRGKDVKCSSKFSWMETHKDVNKHKCADCGRWFIKKKNLKSHILIHKIGKFPKCESCSKGFSDISLLKKDIHNRNRPRSFTYGKSFCAAYQLKIGVSIKKCYKCATCGKSFSYEIILRMHNILFHGETKKYKCEVCGKSFVENHKFQAHVQYHKRKQKYKCETCEKSFTHFSNLIRHGNTHTGLKPHKCEICGNCFTRVSSLKRHIQTHTGIKPYKCETCSKCFSSSGNLKVHVRTHTGVTPYKCETCGKCFTHGSSLKAHVRTHDGSKPYKCETCGKCFTQITGLKSHINTHTRITPYKCETCGKLFTHVSSLKIHVRTHSGIKPYTCQICGKGFTNCSGLKSHIRTHTGEKPYKCETCGKSFIQSSSFKIHVRTHTGIKPYQCENCDKCFTNSSGLKSHTRTHTVLKT